MSRRRWLRFLWPASPGPGERRVPGRRRRPRRRPVCSLRVEALESRNLLSGNSLATAVPVGLNDSVAERLGVAGEEDFFKLTLTESGLLTARTQPDAGSSLASRLSLLEPDGQPLVQSDSGSISQHVLAGTYYVEVTGLGSTTGVYTLTTGFQPATTPFEQVPVGSFLNRVMVAGDFNNDGRLDLATASNGPNNDVSVVLGLGDGTFGPVTHFPVGIGPVDIVAGDFDGDGRIDLATSNNGSNDLSVLLGNGDGTFRTQVRYAAGGFPDGLSAADLNGDGRLDLVTSNQLGAHSQVSVLLGNGDGTFGAATTFAVGFTPRYMAVGDFNDDGRPDLAVANSDSSDVSVLLGKGDGTFQDQVRFAVGQKPSSVIAADFNGDGVLDLATANVASNDLSVLLGNGDGTFRDQVRLPVGNLPECPVAADFNGDGRLDLAVTNLVDGDVSVLLGKGDGTFQSAGRFAVAFQPFRLVAADFDGDGRLDLAASNQVSQDVSVLLGKGDGTFQEQDPEVAVRAGPVTGYAGGANPTTVVRADFNGDGHPDLAVAAFNVGKAAVFLGRGDGTFQDAGQYPVGTATEQLIAGDFNGDGRLDLAVANKDSADVAVLLGNGDGTFQDRIPTFIGLTRFGLAAGDFNGDGRLDLVVTRANSVSTTVRILLGRGDGTFTLAGDYTAGSAPKVPVVADFDGDGFLDVAVTNQGTNDVSVLLGNGDGTFRTQVRYAVGTTPFGLAVADLNGDGHPDLVSANVRSNDVSVLLGNGDGTFQDQARYPAGLFSGWVSTGDFDSDGRLDLVVLDSETPTVSVLLGRGDGTFREPVQFGVGGGEGSIAVGDLNGDGRDDLAVTNELLGDVSVLLGNGDGTFQDERRFPVAVGPAVVAAADFDGDGRPDLARVNPATDTLTVSLGLGDGHFQNPLSLPVGRTPVALLATDLNGDGRADVATANFLSGDVTVFLGLGDGRFEDPLRFAVGFHPTSLAAGDFNGDGQADLAVTGPNAGAVAVLLGNGDGSFGTPQSLALTGLPLAVVAGDFNGDGHDDLAVADEASRDVAVLLGNGEGTFRTAPRLALGTAPVALVTGDFDGDGRLDLATANFTTNDVSVLLGKGDGTFRDAVRWAAGIAPLGLAVGDFNRDGRLDLVAADASSNVRAVDVNGLTSNPVDLTANSTTMTLLPGRGDGTFASPILVPARGYPSSVVLADFTGDGADDLAVAAPLVMDVTVTVSLGDGTFVSPDTVATAVRSVPLVADLNGDGAADVSVIGHGGRILFRAGRLGGVGTFEAPTVVNPEPEPAARDLALVRTPGGLILAALDAEQPALSFYLPHGNTFVRVAGPAVPGALPTRLVAGDLNGDGLDDLLVAANGSSQVFVYLQTPDGFAPTPSYQLNVGLSPSDLALLDVDGDRRPDVIALSALSDTVSVFLNTPAAPFSSELRFRAGSGLVGLISHGGGLALQSHDTSVGLVAGDFNGDGTGDLVVTHSGANTFSVLSGSGLGGFLNPESAPSFTTGSRPTIAVTGHFNADPYLDLAILNQDSGDLSIFLGDGHGGFAEMVARDAQGKRLPLSAGNRPTGLSVADVNGDGRTDLVVGNDFGDVLTLLGNGDGSFQPYQRADRHVALAVADLNGDGTDDLVFGNESLDRVTVQFSRPGEQFVQDRTDGVLAPGAVRVVDLNGDGIKDLVVANSGSNNVLVYLGLGDGRFAPARSFFAGTNPAGVTVASLNDDLVPDPADPSRLIDPTPDLVVANEGSNDVTVLLGRGQGAGWTLADGPRLRLFDATTGRGGVGPVSTTVQDVNGDGLPDILVSARQSNDVFELDGLGRGLFNDQAPTVLDTGADSGPVQALVGNFDGRPGLDLVTVDSASNSLTFFSGFGPGRAIATGGAGPVAAVTGDFNHDGTADLLVANNDSGQVTLLLGAEEGPALARVFADPDVPHPTDLALNDDGSVLYVGEEGEEVAARFTLDLGIAVPAFSDVQSLGAAPGQRLTDLLPLRDSTVATVATVLTVVQDEGAALTPAGEAAAGLAIDLTPAPVPPSATEEGEAAQAATGGGGAEDDDFPGSTAPPDASGDESPPLSLEEELRRNAGQTREHLFDADPPPPSSPERDGAVDEVFREGMGDVGRWLDEGLCDLLAPGGSGLGGPPAPAAGESVPAADRFWEKYEGAFPQAALASPADGPSSALPDANLGLGPDGPPAGGRPQLAAPERCNRPATGEAGGGITPAIMRVEQGGQGSTGRLLLALTAWGFYQFSRRDSFPEKGRGRARREGLERSTLGWRPTPAGLPGR
jgi:hypothetical protein